MSADIVERMLSRLPEEARDRLVPLLESPALIEKLTGRRPSKSACHRFAAKGSRGVRLQVVRVGRARFVSARMLCEFFTACGAAAAVPKKRRRATAGARR